MPIKNQKHIFLQQIDKEFPKAEQRDQKEARIKLLDELEAFEKKYGGKHVRATQIQLGRVNTETFDTAMQKVLRKNCLIEASYFIETNWNAERRGKAYELDVEATDKNIETQEAWAESNRQADQLESEIGKEMTDGLRNIAATAKSKVAKSKKAQQ